MIEMEKKEKERERKNMKKTEEVMKEGKGVCEERKGGIMGRKLNAISIVCFSSGVFHLHTIREFLQHILL